MVDIDAIEPEWADMIDLDVNMAKIIHKYMLEYQKHEDDAITRKIVWAFEQAANLYRDEQHRKHGPPAMVTFFDKPIRAFPRIDVDGRKQMYVEIKEGMDLFSKHYFSFWR